VIELSPIDVAKYREDGFLVIENFLTGAEVDLLRDRLERVITGNFDRVCEPDDYHWKKGRDPDNVTRFMGPVWRCDSALGRFTFSSEHARVVAELEGESSVRLYNDYVWCKPEGGKPIEMHQDAAYNTWVDPPRVPACWIALDDTHPDAGTLFYVKGSHRWGAQPPEPEGLYAPRPGPLDPDDMWWTAYLRKMAPDGREVVLFPLEVEAGTAAFHSGWTWHGSGPNTRVGALRRSYTAHFLSGSAMHHPLVRDPIFSRTHAPGRRELDETTFPVLWSSDGYRSPWIDDYLSEHEQLFNSESASVEQVVDFGAIDTEPWNSSSGGRGGAAA
jgi:ectoine hydroxylase-related dioxygenase (phytanoyl-CoA dioxygenase family)